jgi:serine/threonine protein kinase
MWHRDIKPANILIDKGIYKICDYGLSSVAMANPHSMAYLSSVGSPLYAAPEILNGKQYNSSIDLFSLGVMIYECIYKVTPWPARSI